MSPQPYKAFIYDPHVAVRQGLRAILKRHAISIRGDTDSIDELLKHATAPNLILILGLASEWSGSRGLGLINAVLALNNQARVLAYVDLDNTSTINSVYRSGVRAWVPKTAPIEELIHALHEVARGEIVFSPSVAKRIALYHTRGTFGEDPREVLADKDLSMFVMLAEGLPIPVIADRLQLSQKTVRNRAVTIKHLLKVERKDFRDLAIAHNLILDTQS